MGSVIDDKTFLSSLESVFKIVFAKYDLPFEYEAYLALREQDFLYSLLRKCIDISSDLFMGSLMCNYYSSEFQTFNDVTNSIGYDIYDPLRYREDINLCCPVSVYQSQIEKMGDYVLTHLEYPSEKDEAWWKDLEITKRNLLHLLQPIKHNGVEWLLISGRVMMMDKLDTDAWKDVYDIYICSSSEETIKGDDEDRYLTIETDEYCGNLSEYYQSKQKPWLCKSVKSIAYSSGLFDDTRLLLPPVDIIKALNLRLNLTDMCWYNTSGERIICCNNNKSSYYQDNISGTIFIRKDSFEELCKIKSIKIFAFAEKYIRNRGFCGETDYHFEIIDNKIVKMFSNGTSERASRYERRQSQCKKCPYGFNERSKKSDLRKFLKKLKMDYGY